MNRGEALTQAAVRTDLEHGRLREKQQIRMVLWCGFRVWETPRAGRDKGTFTVAGRKKLGLFGFFFWRGGCFGISYEG